MASTSIAQQGEFRRLLSALGVQRRVVGALILRELHTRYGRSNIGYLWLIGEPMMLASVITLIHLNSSTHFGSDISPVPFTIIGYTIFIIFRGIFNRAEGAIEGNQPLLHHRMVTITDIMLSRGLIEIVGCFTTMCILLTLAVATGYANLPVRPLHLLAAVGFMGWWSFSLGLIAMNVTYHNETLGRLMHPISYFMIPISGAFLQLDWIPEPFRGYLIWFPMPLIFEQARYGMFRSASPEYMAPGYVAVICAILSYWGLLSARRLRRRVAVS